MPKQKRLIIVDANSLIHRAFHALPPLSDRKGQLVNAVYGFLLVLFKVLKEFEPTYAVAAFDAPGPTKREEKFQAYKAKRQKAPNELYQQIPKTKEMLGALGIPSYEMQGFEADDIIGTIATHALRKQIHPPLEIIIVSGDMDTLQLVQKRVKAYALRRGLQDSVLYDEAGVRKRFEGLSPFQLRDYKGLYGDPSDNIPGVTGVGEKTAIKLLQEFGSLENIYESLDKIKPKLALLLSQCKEQAFFSRELGSIETNVPLSFQLKDFLWEKYNRKKAEEALKTFGFQSLLSRLPAVALRSETSGSKTLAKAGERRILEEIEKFYQEGILTKQLYEVEKRLVPVLEAMETRGIKIDKKHFARMEKEIAEKLALLEKEVHKAAGMSFSLNSPRQLARMLFEELHLDTKGLKKTPGGVISTASSELEKLKGEHEIISKVLVHRELQKLYATYIKPLPLMADKKDRVHTTFHQLGTATGRISSSGPNLQNIPVQGESGKEIRKGFIAEKGFRFVSFDYSQMELRLAAFLSGDEALNTAFAKGEDIHRVTAAAVFAKSADSVSLQERRLAKALNFGVLYGMGARGFSQSAAVSLEEAQEFIDSYFMRFPGVHAFIEHAKEFAREKGYAQTFFGRRRYLPDIHSSTPYLRAAAERMAVNHPIQGLNADIMKMAMAEIHEKLLSRNASCAMLLQIHDELLFECAVPLSQSFLEDMRRVMEHPSEARGLSLALQVDVKEGINWGDMI